MIGLGLVGRAGSGKSAHADALERLRPETFRAAFADPIKAEVAARHGITVAHLDRHKAAYRRELQEHGAVGRQEQKWVRLMAERLAWAHGQTLSKGQPAFRFACVDDVRHADEVALLQARGFVVVRLVVPEAELRRRYAEKYGRPMTDEEWNDPSEAGIADLAVDAEWDGLADPEAQIRRWLRELGSKLLNRALS